jgi:uncharacterized protein (TIGR02145 family)
MQAFTKAKCQALPVYDSSNPNPSSTVTLTDTRNNQQYRVRKLADNNCWMIDNLKLELGVTNSTNPTLDTTILEPANTNVTANTPIYFTQDATSTGTALTGMTGNFTTSGDLTQTGAYSLTAPNLDAWRQVDPSPTSTYCAGTSQDSYGGDLPTGNLTKCGYLYNFYTATASTAPQSYNTYQATAPGDICPTNWHLPRGGDYDNANNEFSQLNAKMAGFTDSQDSTYQNDYWEYYSGWQPSGSWQGVFSGYYSSGFYDRGDYGYFWSATVDDSNDAFDLFFDSSYVYPDGLDARAVGFAVRCLVGV